MPYADNNPRFARFSDRLRRDIAGKIIKNSFVLLAKGIKLHPRANPARHGVEVKKDIAYKDTGEVHHTLDVYRPIDLGDTLRPTVLFIHGGGFSILSKETHWVFALALARQGYVVFNINYRLAPEHPFPAAVTDVADAYAFVTKAAQTFGGDPEQLIVMGESAGGNLTLGTAISACSPREEPWCKTIWDTGVVPKAVLPLCGMLQVTDIERFENKPDVGNILLDRLHVVTDLYIGKVKPLPENWDGLVAPLVLLEKEAPIERTFPAVFASCGTKDLLIDDTLRLGKALEKYDARADICIYEGEIHAFQALIWRDKAQESWKDLFAFLEEVLPFHQKGDATDATDATADSIK